MIDGELRRRKARAKLGPEPGGEVVGAAPGAGCVVELAGAVVLRRDDRHVGRHDVPENVRVFRAPLVVVAVARIGPRPVGFGHERGHATIRAAFGLDQVARIGGGLPSELAHHRALVADEPFVVDPVVAGVAVRDGAVLELASARLPVGAVAGVRRGGEDPVRAEHSLLGRPAPDDVLAEQHAIGELGLRGQGGRDHALVADDERGRRAHHDVGRVGGAQRADAPSLPDLPGHAQDEVRQVLVLRVESFQDGHPRGMRAEARGIRVAGRHTLRGGVSGSSMLARSIFTVSATIADAS